MGDLGNLLKVRANPIIGGVVHENRFGIRMLIDSTFDVLHGHSSAIPRRGRLRVDIYWGSTAKYQCVNHTLVNIARENNRRRF